jgi:hypothetical protein
VYLQRTFCVPRMHHYRDNVCPTLYPTVPAPCAPTASVLDPLQTFPCTPAVVCLLYLRYTRYSYGTLKVQSRLFIVNAKSAQPAPDLLHGYMPTPACSMQCHCQPMSLFCRILDDTWDDTISRCSTASRGSHSCASRCIARAVIMLHLCGLK